MITLRQTFPAKMWQEDQLAELLKQWAELVHEQISPDFTYRVYTFKIGPVNTVAWEIDVESLQLWEEARAAMLNNPDIMGLVKQVTDLRERGGTFDVWNLYAQG